MRGLFTRSPTPLPTRKNKWPTAKLCSACAPCCAPCPNRTAAASLCARRACATARLRQRSGFLSVPYRFRSRALWRAWEVRKEARKKDHVMAVEELHISDQDLLRSADGELTGSRARQVRAHLASCWSCRTRLPELA